MQGDLRFLMRVDCSSGSEQQRCARGHVLTCLRLGFAVCLQFELQTLLQRVLLCAVPLSLLHGEVFVVGELLKMVDLQLARCQVLRKRNRLATCLHLVVSNSLHDRVSGDVRGVSLNRGVGTDADAEVTAVGKGFSYLFASLATLREIFRHSIAHVLDFFRFFRLNSRGGLGDAVLVMSLKDRHQQIGEHLLLQQN